MKSRKLGLALVMLFLTQVVIAHPIHDYYKKHKNDANMEARIVPPKMAAMLIEEEDYPEAVDVLKSLTTLKYMNFSGDHKKVKQYHEKAVSAKGMYKLLLADDSSNKDIKIFGIRKKGEIRKLIAVVKTKTEFLLIIGKGKLTEKQLQALPALANELM